MLEGHASNLGPRSGNAHPSTDVASHRRLNGFAVCSVGRYLVPRARLRADPFRRVSQPSSILLLPPSHVQTSALRIVVLTNGTLAGRALLEGLVERGLPLAAVMFESHHEVEMCRRATTPLARLLETPVAVARSIWRRVRAHRLVRARIGWKPQFVLTVDRNGAAATRRLTGLRPDILLLAGVGIITSELLAIPRLGTLNTHPGLLPWARGNGVVFNSVLREVAIGATCHLVDPGIDTGPIIARRLLRIDGPESLESIERRAGGLATGLMLDVVARAVAGASLPEAAAQRERYPLCRWHDPAGKASASRLLVAGRGAELYTRWKSASGAGDTDDLPNDLPGNKVPAITVPPVRAASAVAAS